MEIRDTRLEGAKLILPRVFGDARGFFGETFRESVLADHGIRHDWIQDNHSRSDRGVVRGMHFQIGTGAAKLVRCARGEIWDVIVDLRRRVADLPAVGGVRPDRRRPRRPLRAHRLRARVHRALEVADVVYKQTEYYSPEVERGIAYDDPDVAIAWPDVGVPPSVSDRDAAAPCLRDVEEELPF
jgi:dTDP-4-dehydrorhamnose 3,5-epimerase